jgi:hypothetical protein
MHLAQRVSAPFRHLHITFSHWLDGIPFDTLKLLRDIQ